MADSGQQKGVTSAFPPPPPFWKHFTRQNLAKLEQRKAEAQGENDGSRQKQRNWSPEELRALKLPTELRYLVPPELPTSGSYSLFGEAQTISTSLPSLESQGIEQLYPSTLEDATSSTGPSNPSNHASYLLKISKSLLLNFLELVGLLSVSPERFEPKLGDIRNLFINAHHLLNLYRPHQARESLILMMEEQLQRSKDEIQEMESVSRKVETFLKELEDEGRSVMDGVSIHDPKPEGHEAGAQAEETAVVDARKVWNLLDEFDDT